MSRRRRRWLNLENKHEPLAPAHVYRRRLRNSAASALALIAVSLLIGVAGYHWICGIPSWVDCLYNASMILGGMGPVAEIGSDAGKVFASFYALFSGVVLLASVGVTIAPAVHRVLHQFHVECEDDPS